MTSLDSSINQVGRCAYAIQRLTDMWDGREDQLRFGKNREAPVKGLAIGPGRGTCYGSDCSFRLFGISYHGGHYEEAWNFVHRVGLGLRHHAAPSCADRPKRSC